MTRAVRNFSSLMAFWNVWLLKKKNGATAGITHEKKNHAMAFQSITLPPSKTKINKKKLQVALVLCWYVVV
jgi:hypothetical protein